MINWQRVNTLREEIGEEDFDEVKDLFMEEASETVARLQSARDPADLSAELHALKGLALNLGFTDLGQLCEKGEAQVTAGQTAQVPIAPILACYEGSRRVFLSGLAECPPPRIAPIPSASTAALLR